MALRISTILRQVPVVYKHNLELCNPVGKHNLELCNPVGKHNSYFDNVFTKCKEDVIFKTVTAFNKDPSPKKVNLSIGIYADEYGVLPPVNSRYLPLSGDPEFLAASERFVFGGSVPGMYKFQTCGGTGALSLARDIVTFNRVDKPQYAMPLPTWPNHTEIFKGTNVLEQYHSEKMLYVPGFKRPDVLLVQTSCHNPTGIEYTDKERMDILDYAERKNVCVIFDTAYLGLTGDFNSETSFLKMAAKRNIEFFVCLSYSKIADAYGHRLGALMFRPLITSGVDVDNIKPNIEQLIRTNISNTPRYGSDEIMKSYLGSDKGVEEFKGKIQGMAERINSFRKRFGRDLAAYGIENNISDGRGMFSLLNMTSEEITRLRDKYNVYVLPNGRINICGITNDNYDYVLQSIVNSKVKID
jgi:aspartate/tyrosine/aromatic aminotransferase